MSTPPPSLPPPVKPNAVDARVDRLFRAFLAQGQMHPLYLQVLRYRQTHPAP